MSKQYDHKRFFAATRERLRDSLDEMSKRKSDLKVVSDVGPDGRPFINVTAVGRSAGALEEVLRELTGPQAVDDAVLQAAEPSMFPVGSLVKCVSEGSKLRGMHGVVAGHRAKIEVKYATEGEKPAPFAAFHVGTDLMLEDPNNVNEDKRMALWFALGGDASYQAWLEEAELAFKRLALDDQHRQGPATGGLV